MAAPQAAKTQLIHSCVHATHLTHINEVAFIPRENIFGLFGTNWDKQTQMWKEYLWEKDRSCGTTETEPHFQTTEVSCDTY